jgi:argininosuccinate lyase
MTFDAIETTKSCIVLFRGMLSTMKFRKDKMRASANGGFTNATDAADYLVNHGVPFRDAHGIIGQIVLKCIEDGKAIDDLTLEQLQEFSDKFEEDIFDAISMETCVNKRLTVGAPGVEAMKPVIEYHKTYLQNT